MGLNSSTPEDLRDKEIDRMLRKAAKQELRTIKLLLVGPGESGKSTLRKQLECMYGEQRKLSLSEVHDRKLGVYDTILKSIGALAAASTLADPTLEAAKDLILNNYRKKDCGMTAALIDAFKSLWNDEGVRNTWEQRRNQIQAQESLEYFMEQAERILAPDYKPTEMDWLRSRVKTAGVHFSEFQLQKGVPCKIFDAGGQRSERKKWARAFTGVTSLISVIAISEYDEVLCENNRVNRMEESLTVFEEMVNHKAFESSGMLLFLNKDDIFRKKILTNPIKVENGTRWQDFLGPQCTPDMDVDGPLYQDCYKAGIEYFAQKFLDLNGNPDGKEVYVHVTAALNRQNVDAVFRACYKIVLKHAMFDAGLKF